MGCLEGSLAYNSKKFVALRQIWSMNESLSFIPVVRASLGFWVKEWIWYYEDNL